MNARTLVHRRTAERARRFPDLDPRPLLCEELSARDAALARAIDHEISRRWLTLAAVIDSRLTDQRWASLNPSVQAALLVGAAQLLFMEKVPDHAAIDQSVRWIKTTRRSRASGLVNAVLRKVTALRGEVTAPQRDLAAGEQAPRDAIVLSDGRRLRLAEPIFDERQMMRVVQQTSCNEELIAHWVAAFDRATATKLALHGLVHAPIIISGVVAQKSGTGILPVLHPDLLEPHDEPGFFIFTGDRGLLIQLLAQHPQARVQDPTTARSVNLARRINPEPSIIIDYCAGKGTKTHQLAEMFPNARIVATERDAERFAALRELVAGLSNAEVVPFGSIREHVGTADLLVLDVPCSNTGVLARRMEAKYRFTRASHASLVTVQRQILADALPLMKDDAWLLYTTCSIEPSENHQQVEWMTQTLPLTLCEQQFTLPAGMPGDPPSAYHDGGFAALMRWTVG